MDESQTLAVEAARAKLGELAHQARLNGVVTFVTLYGKPAAAIVPHDVADDYLRRRDQPHDAAAERLALHIRTVLPALERNSDATRAVVLAYNDALHAVTQSPLMYSRIQQSPDPLAALLEEVTAMNADWSAWCRANPIT